MGWILPGTVLCLEDSELEKANQTFSSLFLAGGISLSQVSAITGLEAHMVQNWVRRGFLSSPENKKYSLEQLCRIISINMLRSTLALERICELLGYVNGRLDDTSDDIIKDSTLYFTFLRLAHSLKEDNSAAGIDRLITENLSSYAEPTPGAKKRVETALRVMLSAWVAARLKKQAEDFLLSISQSKATI